MSQLHYSMWLPQQIVFGWGQRQRLGGLAASLGARAFLLVGSQTLQQQGIVAELQGLLTAAGVTVETEFAPSREPEVHDVDELTARWLARGIGVGDCVIALGGGSTIDLAKAAAAMATNREGASVRDYLEGVGRGYQLTAAPIPLLAMPTTAGTGSEATKNAVISSYDPLFKKSLRSDQMLPRIVLVDPELTVTVPPRTTAYCGMDALTQLVESYISRKANAFTQGLCREGFQRGFPALKIAVQDGTNAEARSAMCHAALLSGMALANSGLGLAHGVAAALGVHCRVPHGLACALMLVPTLRYNRVMKAAELAELARGVWPEDRTETEVLADRLIEHLQTLCDELQIPRRLRDVGVERGQLAALVPASRGNSLSGNPRDVSDADLLTILESIW